MNEGRKMSYIFDNIPKISMPEKANNSVVGEILSNYTYGKNWDIDYSLKDNSIKIGSCTVSCYNESEYVINATDEGIYIGGADYSALMHGFADFLEKMKYNEIDKTFYMENVCVRKSPLLKFRCVHLCVFPETEMEFLKKTVRSCALAKYSNIILEFWGTLKFDCMRELAWPFAHEKSEIKEVVKEANALGVEIIPMFNHLGHASSCREFNGKHVVLDQNPSLEYMFDSYGWVWNISRDDVRKLLSDIRSELIELCGEGKYFHLGCDEVYSYGHNEGKALEMCDYLNDVAKELAQKGRRPIIWHDMLASSEEFPGYFANSDKNVADMLVNKLNKNFVIADWQYIVKNEIWKTSQKLKENGFDVVCCPWNEVKNVEEATETAINGNFYGIIQTTWHTLNSDCFRQMIYSGMLSYGIDKKDARDIRAFYCANLARKVMPSNGEYEKSGWSKRMISNGFDY